MKLREKIVSIFKRKGKTVRAISEEINVPKSTVQHTLTQTKLRQEKFGSDYWNTEEGYRYLIKLVVSSIYFFCVKNGLGAGQLKVYFEMIELGSQMGVSETTILKIIKEVEGLLIDYGDSKTKEIKSKVEEIELILGVDETWFDRMLLVCQDLQSGFIFCEEEASDRSATTWDKIIKKTFRISK